MAEWDEVFQDPDRGGGVRVRVGSVLSGLLLVAVLLGLFLVGSYAGVTISHDDSVSCHSAVSGGGGGGGGKERRVVDWHDKRVEWEKTRGGQLREK